MHLQIDVPGLPVQNFVAHVCSPQHLPAALEQLADAARDMNAEEGRDMALTAPGGLG
jgi:hypothetical protein